MTIFVGGVHGVGKSTLCAQYALSQGDRWIHLSAGNVIATVISKMSEKERQERGNRNQEILLSGLKEVDLKGRRLLLDGHFVLRKAEAELSPVPLNIFEKLNIGKIVLMEAKADSVIERLRIRDKRNDLIKTEIENFLSVEKARAEFICRELNLPLIALFEPTIEQFSEALNS